MKSETAAIFLCLAIALAVPPPASLPSLGLARGVGGVQGGNGAPSGLFGRSYNPCPGSIAAITNQAYCCKTDVLGLGLANLDCEPPSSDPQNAMDFINICWKKDLTAKCCTVGLAPVGGLICNSLSCNTSGLRWEYYKFAKAPTNTATEPGKIPYNDRSSNWTMTYLNVATLMTGQIPNNTNTTTTIGKECGSKIYGQTVDGSEDYSVLQHIGYLHPNKTGNYTFTVSNVDDAIYMWLGANAVSGFTNDNANLVGPLFSTTSFTFSATANSDVPIRILFVNAQQCGAFNFKLVDPEGQIVVSNSQPVTNGQLINC